MEMLLVPIDRKDFDSPVSLTELVPKLPGGSCPSNGAGFGWTCQIYVLEDAQVLLDGDWHP